jgi:hypothetical protein
MDVVCRSCLGFNPMAQPDADLFERLMGSGQCVRNTQPPHPITADWR